MLKKVLFALIGILIVGLVILTVLLNYRPRPIQLQENLLENVSAPKSGELTVQFLGNTNLLFSDGKTSILTDGFFSYPSAYKVLYGEVEPNRAVIEECLNRAGITSLDAVIPLHSHFDHAMDAPMVADITGGFLIGSSSTANIGRGYGLKENRIRIPTLDSTMQIGDFKITFIKSNHWQYPDAEQRKRLLKNKIEVPLVTPASIYEYKEGDSYTLLIQHGDDKIAVQGSAGYVEHSLPEFDADILFLSIAGLEVMSEDYNQAYQDHLISPLSPEVLVPIHWDDFTVKLSDKPLKTPSLLFSLMLNSDLSKAFYQVEQKNPNREIKVLPTFRKISINDIK